MFKKLLICAALLWTMNAHSADPTTGTTTQAEPVERSMFTCRRLVGLTGGLMTTDRAWVFIDDGPIRLLGSPIVGASCELGFGPTRGFVGVESAPFYETRRLNQSDLGRNWLTISAGVSVSRGVWSGGPFVAGGWGWLGVGGRALYLPWKGASGRRGFEGRLTGVYNGGFGAQAMVLYTLSSTNMGATR